jgi:4'-phosphopantetheinyl transferase
MPDERTRSANFQFERDQQRFIVARGVLRDLLGRYLHIQPGKIGFVYNAFGKPDLVDLYVASKGIVPARR